MTFTHTHTHSRTPLDECSAHRRDLYLTTHNTYKRQTAIPPAGFIPAIPASKRPQKYALDRAAIGSGKNKCIQNCCRNALREQETWQT